MLPALTTTSSLLPLASFKTVYDVPAVEKRLKELTRDASEGLRSTYEQMIQQGGERLSIKPSTLPDFDELVDELPNFAEPLDDVKKQLALVTGSRDRLEVTPMLLLGEPGIGKTHFAKRLAELLGTETALIPMNAMTAGWILSGASSQWKHAKPGKVFEAVVRGRYSNPVLVVDEIDKAAGAAQYDPLGALYGLLEHDTACEFTDEFAEVPVDCSEIVWVATANDASAIPEPILNRMNVYEIDSPDEAGVRRIARNLYRELRNGHDWGQRFPEEPAEALLDALAGSRPREIRRLLAGAFGAARLAGRDEVQPDDLALPRLKRRQKIGFTQA
jgi:ATP-dependent Lon protease